MFLMLDKNLWGRQGTYFFFLKIGDMVNLGNSEPFACRILNIIEQIHFILLLIWLFLWQKPARLLLVIYQRLVNGYVLPQENILLYICDFLVMDSRRFNILFVI